MMSLRKVNCAVTPVNHYLLRDEQTDSDGAPRSPETVYDKNFLAWCVFNRDMMHLEFFRRLLEEALDDSLPLLERLKFLSIFSSNLDEFFMVRVSGLKEMLGSKEIGLMPGELKPAEQLKIIREKLLVMLSEHARCLRDVCLRGLKAQNVVIASYGSLSKTEKRELNDYFMSNVYRLLTPVAVDPAHPFPYISSLNLNIGVMIEPIAEHGITRSLTGLFGARFARIEVPESVPRLVPFGKGKPKFVLLEELIEANFHSLFPRMCASRGHVFRVTRDADLSVKEDKAADLLGLMRESLRERHFGMPVRLEVSATMPGEMVAYLTDALLLDASDVYMIDSPLDVTSLMALYDINIPKLKDAPVQSVSPARLGTTKDYFSAIKRHDILLHHPYTAYTSVTDFIEAAAKDPAVHAIKMCLYRTGRNSPILKALIEASERGKHVTAVVEIKARFDEENNIECADRLAQAGVHVVYGVMKLKTHSKIALVVRREEHGLQTYVHIATGNYNPTTSKIYTDFGLLTADSEIGNDASDLFNFLTGFSRQKEYSRLLVAPVNMRERMLALIERETINAREGRPSGITVKVNRLTDTEIIAALYEASQASTLR